MKTLTLFAICLFTFAAYAQDIRLKGIKTVYIVPNGDDKETAQLEEKIPKVLGWEVTNDKTKADALVVYSSDAGNSQVVNMPPPGMTTGTVVRISVKSVALYTNTKEPDLIWKTQHRGAMKIAGTAVDKLKRDVDKLNSKK